MRVRFWGTRGSIPSPGGSTVVYGGNTSCVEVEAGDGSLLILDCGTGIRDLGLNLLRTKPGTSRLYMLISHTHWDHIQGFPFFPPLFLKNVELNIYAPMGFQRGLEDSITGQMQYAYFPVKLQDLPSRTYYTELAEGFFRIGEVLVKTQYLNHTAPTIAYRITDGTATIVYVTDHEPFWNVPGPVFLHPGDRRHVEFLSGADLIIHDAQYTAQEYETKRGWGHSSVEYATDVAVAAQAARLALFHHDPLHDDEALKRLEMTARQRAASVGSELEVFCAAEGRELELHGRRLIEPATGTSALEFRTGGDERILLLLQNPADRTSVRASLREGRYIITETSDIGSAAAFVAQSCPDLVITSADVGGGLADSIEALRNASANPELPVLVLTEAQDADENKAILQGVATDYIAKPFGLPMFRSRVHAWTTRGNRASVVATERSDTPPPDSPHVSAYRVLASSSIFADLTDAQVLQLTRRGTEQVYSAGEAIIRQDDPSDSVYVVLSGRVRVVKSVPDSGMDVVLGEFGVGEMLGELGVLRNELRSATVLATAPARCLKISAADFTSALEDSTELCVALYQILAERLHRTNRLLARYVPDLLTGLPSRLAFSDLYQRLAGSVRRRSASLLLMVIDIVHLKHINDQHGYLAGDNVLRAVSDVLVHCCPGNGLVARYGGDEFAVLVPDAAADQIKEMIIQFRARLHQMTLSRPLAARVNCRIGFASAAPPPESADELLREADKDMQARHVSLIGS